MADPQLPIGQEEADNDDSVFLDLLAAPFRGIEGAVQGIYNLADFVAFDILPDYDEKFLGKSTTVAGSAVEGIAQFMTGFVPIFGWAGRAGSAAKAGSMTQKALGGTVRRGVVAGAVTDFSVFNGQEARLSNFIQQYPSLQNPVTEFLAHDDEEGEIAGRLKNVLEGLGLEAVTFGFIKGLKAMKRGREIRANEGTPDDLYEGMQEVLGTDGVKLMPDFDRSELNPQGKAYYDFYNQIDPLVNDLFPADTAKRYEWETDEPPISLAKKAFYKYIGIEEPSRSNVLDRISLQMGTTYNRPSPQIDFTDPKLKDAVAEGLFKDWARANNKDAEGLLGPNSGWTATQKRQELKKYADEAEAILTKIQKGFDDAPTAPKVKGFKTQGDPFEVGDSAFDIDFLKAGGKLTVMSPDEYIDMAIKADPKRSRKDIVNERLENVERMARNKKALQNDASPPLSIYRQADGTYDQEGLHRALAAKELGLTEVPVIVDASRFKADAPTRNLPDLMDGKSFDEAIEARPAPQPYKTNLKAKRGLEGSRGSEAIKKRLRLEANLKNADPSDVKDIETFIDTVGERMFDDVSLSISSKLDSKGRFEFANSLVTLRKNVVEGGDLTRTGVHELWHSLSRNLPNKDLGRLKAQFTRERNKYLKGTGKDVEDFKKGTYSDDNYRYSDIDEYFAEEMTDAFLSKLDADDALAPQGTFKRVAQEIAIMLKDMFASVKSKLGIDQRQKIFNDFVKQRNVKKQRSGPLGTGDVKKMQDFADEVSPEHAGIAKAITRGETVTLPRFETTDQQHSFIEALRAEVASDRKTMERMKEEAEAGLPVDFGDNTITDRFKNMEQTVENQKQVRLEATVYKKIGEGLVSKLHEAAKAYRESGGGDVATANLKNIFQEVVGFSEQYFRLGRETSLTLGNRRQKMGRRKLGLTESEMKAQGIRKNFVNENGKMNVEKIVSAIEEGVDPDNLVESINGMFKLARKTQGRKFLDMPAEYWINSILSGPRTQMVNIIGNTLTSVLSTIEAAAGGLMTGNLEVTRQAFASWADMSMFREAMSFAGKAWKSRENVLDPDARAFNEGRSDAITPEAFPDRLTDNPRFYKAIEWAGNFLRTPSRLLMTTDEFFKQLNYRRAARFKLAMQGMEQGMTDPKQLAEYIEKGLEDVITSGGRHYSEESLIREGTQMAEAKGITDSKEQAAFVSQHVQDNTKEGASALADFALEESRYLTFTKDLDKGTLGAAIQGAQQTWSPLRFVMPFVRTPTNILAYAFERTPLGMIPSKPSDWSALGLKSDKDIPFPFLKSAREKFYKDIKGNDPIAKAQALGKMATSTAMTALMVDMAWNSREYITGGGPKNPEEKKALEATGWKPYSIKINDTYYSYQRLDPVGTLLGVAADMVDHGLRSPKNFDQSAIDRVFSALSLTLVRNVTNKSYLAGVQMFTNALSDPERYGDRLLRNFGSSWFPFSGFFSQVQYGTGTQEAREVRSFADAFLNKIPGGRDNLDPKRNVLGESVMIENLPLIGALNPVAYSTVKNDPVLTEMASLNHAFREPRSTYGGLIDLLEYTNDSGQTAHDRRLELLQSVQIGGRTLKQALSRLIKSRNYQRLPQESEPGLPSPRIQKINSLLTKYRNEALDSAMNEFPELSQYYDQVTRAKRQYRQGADHSSVLSLLNQ